MPSSTIRIVESALDDVLAWHVTSRLADDRAIARTPEDLRLASVIMKRHGEPRGLLAYSVSDTHSHALLACDRVTAGRFALFCESALHKCLRLPVCFEAARIRPIRSPRHGVFSVRYVFQQAAHHGPAFDLALDGCSLPELLGMRCVEGGMPRRIRELFPRLRRAQLLEWLGAPGFEACETDPQLIVEATAGAFLLPTLIRTGAREASARTAAVHVLHRLHPSVDAGELLMIPDRSLRRYRSMPAVAADCRAVELQLRFRSWLAGRALGQVA